MPSRQTIIQQVKAGAFLRTGDLSGPAASLVKETPCPNDDCPGRDQTKACFCPSGCHYSRRDALVEAIRSGAVKA